MFHRLLDILACVWAAVPSHGFNIDTEGPEIFAGNKEGAFGQRVLQFGNQQEPWIIVSAPLQTGNATLYRCSAESPYCEPIDANGLLGNASLLTVEASATQLVVCNPSVAQPCASNMHLSGVCYLFNNKLQALSSLTPGYEECPIVALDVVFLFDGSNSLSKRDLENNKRFMLNMMNSSDTSLMQFAVVQYSGVQKIELNFKEFRDEKIDLAAKIKEIKLMESVTLTANAIDFVIKNVFTEDQGARDEATRLLIVITDGETTAGDQDLAKTIESAEEKNIIRCAIGVGDGFSPGSRAEKELETIASSPSYLIKVKSYGDLQNIFEGLKSKIYNIEGTHTLTNESSFAQELAQGGFSALLTRDTLAVGTVGAFDWSGGLLEIRGNSSIFINISKSHSDMKNSYLGYSLAGVVQGNRTLYVVGAPRYQHRGKVIVFELGANGSQWVTRQNIQGEQIGSYFGSELCTVDLTSDGETDLLLIGAPLFHEQWVGGVVIVCNLGPEGNFSCPLTLRGKAGDGLGRFGSAIAELGDLNGDGMRDVAVGAPLEDGHRGCIYIYHGSRSGIGPGYSQRISGVSVSPGLSYFGQSVHGTMDMNKDGLTDVVVGALGKAVLFRSRPVVDVMAEISFRPREIALWTFACPWNSDEVKPGVSDLTVCFNISLATPPSKVLGKLRANLSYHIELDSNRQMQRVMVESAKRTFPRYINVTEDNYCFDHQVLLSGCVEDYLTPIEVQVKFALTPLPVEGPKDLQPILNERCAQQLSMLLPVEKNCGEDDLCKDNLNVTFHLGGMKSLLVGNSAIAEIHVSLENLGEDSYKTVLTLYHPPGLQFRKLTNPQTIQVNCASSLNSTGNGTGIFLCNISHPIFRSEGKASFIVTFEISDHANWEDRVSIRAEGKSDNELRVLTHSSHTETVPVQYAVKIIISRVGYTRYISLHDGKEEQRTIKHVYKVENLGDRGLPVNVTFNVPKDVAGIVRWELTNGILIQPDGASDCVETGEARRGTGQTTGQPAGDTAAVTWSTIFCRIRVLDRNASVLFSLIGSARSLGKMATSGAKIVVASEAYISLDQRKFIDVYSSASHRVRALTEIEFHVYVNKLPYVIGSSIAGFLVLIIIIFVFYKIGFFKRNFRDKLCDDGEEASNPITPATSEDTTPTGNVSTPND
ncbi:integrin alpha-D-like [Heterodontus francisci]|uniref:integrin alpha-D-like n=1 Tax=Heterodontus francisci TaxID=7792 RepID=UPI00355AEC8F